MPTAFPFSEARIKALKPPGKDRDYHKDTKLPGLQVAVFSTGVKVYYLVKRIDGRPTRLKLGTTRELSVEAAREAAAATLGDVATGKNPQAERQDKRHEPTLEVLFEHWKLYAKAHKRPKSYSEDERQYKRFLTPWANRRLITIKKPDVQALHARIGRENGIYAANRLLALLRAMLNKAEEIGFEGSNPAAGVKLFKETQRDRFMRPEELQAFFTALEDEIDLFRDFFLVALFTGARRSNVQAMRWAELDLSAAYWRISETKGGMPVIVPLVAPVLAILKRRQNEAEGGPWVFPGYRRGQHIMEPKGAWKRVLVRAGLSDLRPHDLRRSLGSYMAMGGTSLPIIGKVLGHSQAQTTMIYARIGLDPQREAVEKATTAMLTAGGQAKLLQATSTKGGDDGQV